MADKHDLRTFLQSLNRAHPDSILRIRERVDRDYDVTAVAMELEREGRFPVLWFDRVGDYPFPLVTNIFGDRSRFAFPLGVPEAELIQRWGQLGDVTIDPVRRNTGPVLDVVMTGAEVDLDKLPIMKHFSEDGGRYITNAVIVANDPDTGVRNASYHRCQVKGANRLGTSLHSRRHLWDYAQRAQARDEALPVAIVIGHHPLFHFGSGLWKGPIGMDEYAITGGFLGAPLEVVRGITVPVDIPADAEFVIEGRLLPHVREPEGPFAEFTGYASERSTQQVIEVTAILHRRDAIYQDIVAGISAEHTNLLAVPQEARLMRQLRQHFPGVTQVSYPRSGTCRLHCYIAMRQTAEGQAKNAALAAMADDLALKLVVVVDDDVDITRDGEVLWAMATRMQAESDIAVIRDAMGAILDPSSRQGTTDKMIIDATRPPGAFFPRRHTLPADALARVPGFLGGATGGLDGAGPVR
jgi:UbiD family decarboxylase